MGLDSQLPPPSLPSPDWLRRASPPAFTDLRLCLRGAQVPALTAGLGVLVCRAGLGVASPTTRRSYVLVCLSQVGLLGILNLRPFFANGRPTLRAARGPLKWVWRRQRLVAQQPPRDALIIGAKPGPRGLPSALHPASAPGGAGANVSTTALKSADVSAPALGSADVSTTQRALLREVFFCKRVPGEGGTGGAGACGVQENHFPEVKPSPPPHCPV